MLWLYLSLISAVLLTLSTLIQKRGLQSEHAMEFSAVFSVAVAVMGLPLLFKVANFNIPPIVWLYTLVNAMLSALSFFLWAKAVRHMDISSSSPFLGLAPAVTAFLSFLLLGERFNNYQILGIILLVLGTCGLSGVEESIERMSKVNILKSKFVWFILLSVCLYSVGTIFDKVVISQYKVDLYLYLVLLQIFIALGTVFMLYVFHDGFRGLKNGFANYGLIILGAAIVTVAHRITYLAAAGLFYIGLVVAIKRSSILLSTILGGEIFHEKDLLRKGLSSVVIIAGIFLIVWK